MPFDKKTNGVGRPRLPLSEPGRKNHSGANGHALTTAKRRPEDLTAREREVLRLIWGGHTNRSIAEQLKISIKTAEAHRSNMMKKLRVSNTAQLIKAALEGRILHADDAVR
jgi:DNA-binding NarL/FixJ family response regulator